MPNIFQHFACPTCKSTLRRIGCSETNAGHIKFGSLFCDPCASTMGTVSFGKADFLRVTEPISSQVEHKVVDDFSYKRIPWSDVSISSLGCTKQDLGWNAEGFTGCLLADREDNWEIVIETDATDMGIRCLQHAWSGKLKATVNGGDKEIIDLYDANDSQVNCHIIFRDMLGHKTVKIQPAGANESSNGNQIYFFGYDACFSASLNGREPSKGKGLASIYEWAINKLPVEFQKPSLPHLNRGNEFPPMYEWALAKLPSKALVLDCGCGDRRFGDARVIGFEYMSFELPDVFGDGHALPFLDETFDVVFSQAVMEHMRDPYLAAREIARVLKPGGLVYVESAFMQPLHAVPYHFFNTTPWGIEELFLASSLSSEITEWFGPLSGSFRWYLDSLGGGGLSPSERETIHKLLLKADANTSYEALKPVASAVAFWGIKAGASDLMWQSLLSNTDRPSFRY
jgi:SAM-dependent methyltransferase